MEVCSVDAHMQRQGVPLSVSVTSAVALTTRVETSPRKQHAWVSSCVTVAPPGTTLTVTAGAGDRVGGGGANRSASASLFAARQPLTDQWELPGCLGRS